MRIRCLPALVYQLPMPGCHTSSCTAPSPSLPPALQASPPKPGTSPAMNTPHMEVFQRLLRDMDTGGCTRKQVARGWSWLAPSSCGCGMLLAAPGALPTVQRHCSQHLLLSHSVPLCCPPPCHC